MTLADYEVTYGSTMIDGQIIDRIDGLGVFRHIETPTIVANVIHLVCAVFVVQASAETHTQNSEQSTDVD